MSQQKTRYNCNWDVSNQNKAYTIEEKKFIKESYENGVSLIDIAKAVKRGLWAVQVQIKYYLVKDNYQTRPSKHVQKQHVQQKQKQKQKQKSKSRKNLRKRIVKFQRRKFESETEVLIKTSKTEIEDHVNELMGVYKTN